MSYWWPFEEELGFKEDHVEPLVEVKETEREILYDVFDIENAKNAMNIIKGKVEIRVTRYPSYFAHRFLLFGESDIIFMKDRRKRLIELYEKLKGTKN